MFRVIIAGSRSFRNFNLLVNKCDKILSAVQEPIVIVSGTAQGADRLGERYAELRGYGIDRHPAQWEKFGKSAGYKRNVEMAKSADALIAFPVGATRGTQHMIKIATDTGMPVRVIQT